MNLSDEQIKRLLQETELSYQKDDMLEEEIMQSIHQLKSHQSDTQKARKKALWSLRVSMALGMVLLLTIFFSLSNTQGIEPMGLGYYLPSIMVIVFLLIAFVLKEFVFNFYNNTINPNPEHSPGEYNK